MPPRKGRIQSAGLHLTAPLEQFHSVETVHVLNAQLAQWRQSKVAAHAIVVQKAHILRRLLQSVPLVIQALLQVQPAETAVSVLQAVSPKDLTTCEQCPAGKYASLRSFQCTGCPSNHVAKPGSGKCESCESRIIRSTPDATKQSCQPESMDLILAVISAIASSCFCFLCLLGFHGRIALADISAQGEKNGITTVNSHFLMKSWCPQVTFAGTGVPHLDGTSSKVKALSSFQLTLHGKSEKPLDTSMGHVTVKFPRAYLQIGLWRCPLLGWCLLFGAAAAAAMIPTRVVPDIAGCWSGHFGWGFGLRLETEAA